MAKVFLFNPPGPGGKAYTREGRCTQESGVWGTQWPPVTLATAGAMLEADGHTVTVVDFPANGMGMAQLDHMMRDFLPDLAVWNTGTPTLSFDLDIAKVAKSASPNTVTAVMGTHVSSETDPVFTAGEVDIVIRREPEQIIRNLSRTPKDRWGEVDGISYRDSFTGNIRHNPDALFLPPETIPFPAWHLLDLETYRLPLKGRRFLTVAPSRGCPFDCNFCTAQIYYGKKLRTRSVDAIVAEIEHSIARYQITDFFIWADTFTANRGHVRAFCNEILRRRLDISWTCNSRVDTVDRDLLALMKKAGLWMISFGLESGDEGILRRTGKKITPAQSRKAVGFCHDLGVRTSGHFILGLPGETCNTMQKTLDLALDLPLDIVQFYTAAPFPGTRLYREAVDKGWLNEYTLRSQNRAAMDLPGLPSEVVDAFRRSAYRKFYLRWSAVLRLLKMFEFTAFTSFLASLKGFFKWAKG